MPSVEADPPNNLDEDEEKEEKPPPSGFDRIEKNYEVLEKLVKKIQELFEIFPSNDAGPPTTGAETSAANSNNGSDPAPSPAGATTTSNENISEATAIGNSSTANGGDSAAAGDTTTPTTSNEITSEPTAIGNSSTANGGDSATPAAGDATTPTTSNENIPEANGIGNSSTANEIISEADRLERSALRKDVIHILKNLEYIKKHVKEVQSSSYSERAEELLLYLMDAAKDIKPEDFHEDVKNLKHLLHIFAKLKQWIPPQRDNAAEESRKNKSKKKKKGSPFVSKEDKVNAAAYIVEKLVSYDCKEWEMDGLLKSYGELKVRDKLCLLCFSLFLCDVDKVGEPGVLVQKNLVIKKKILIYWWVGEGLIHPNQPSPSPIPNSTTNTDPQNPDQVWPPREDEGMTIEKIGDKILNALRMKGFIEPVMKRGRESGSYQMLPFVHSFVTALAKKAGFFDFSKLDGTLTHRFGLSQRACLLKSQGNSPSSCSIWKRDIDNRTKLKKFATVQTLFNVNESIIDIKPEWFSKMKYLSVLHLGSWRSEAGEHIEVEDPKFMEELKNMKQLKLFSLQGVATIMKLPDSVCKLSNLIILDLRECHNLEELPANIGELKNLTHLDLTNCHLLTKLPIGISLLSKLQVLNWFVIYNQDGEKEVQKSCFSKAWNDTKGFVVHDLFRRDNKEVCALKDLLNLGSLRELSIVVNRNKFPSKYEAELLMEMIELRTLKISWVYDVKDETNNNTLEDPPSKQGCCFCLKKSKMEVADSRNIQEEEQDTNQTSCFHNLEKLELWCFPGKNPPDWLVPDKLLKLKKLYIKGGKLETLVGKKWNVQTLRLKYMEELKIEWRPLLTMFPDMTYLEKFQCPKLGLFPCDHEGVWLNEEKIAKPANPANPANPAV